MITLSPLPHVLLFILLALLSFPSFTVAQGMQCPRRLKGGDLSEARTSSFTAAVRNRNDAETGYSLLLGICNTVVAPGCNDAIICIIKNVNGNPVGDGIPLVTSTDFMNLDWSAANTQPSFNIQGYAITVPTSSSRPVPLPNTSRFEPRYWFIQSNRKANFHTSSDTKNDDDHHSHITPIDFPQNTSDPSILPPILPPTSGPPTSGPPTSGPPTLPNVNYTWPIPLCSANRSLHIQVSFVCGTLNSATSYVILTPLICVYVIELNNIYSCELEPPEPTGSSSINTNIVIAIAVCCLIGSAVVYILGGYLLLRFACNRRGTQAYSHLLCVKSLEECCCGLDTGIYSADTHSPSFDNINTLDRVSPNSSSSTIQAIRTDGSSIHLPDSPESVTRNSNIDARNAGIFTPSLCPRTTELCTIADKI
jgi:hypothetical protein